MEFSSTAQALPSSQTTAGDAGRIVFPAPAIRTLGLRPYEPTWRDMQSFTVARDADTRDELWVLEHPPVYTLGLASREEHLPRMDNAIPVVKTDRGGQITYHGPGQAIVYALVDLARRGIKVRDMVCLLEQAAIDLLAAHGIAAARKSGAPGVYVLQDTRDKEPGAKIAALGLKVKRQGCYHGISLNVDMDLAPFAAIDPCGYPGLAVTSLCALGVKADVEAIGVELARRIADSLDKHAVETCR